MSARSLTVYRKTEELLYRYYPALFNYPKAEKFGLCQDIKRTFFDLLRCIALGNAVRAKRKVYLQEADGHLQLLKVLVKLSRQRRYISKGFYQETDVALTEINKMLSAYIKSASD